MKRIALALLASGVAATGLLSGTAAASTDKVTSRPPYPEAKPGDILDVYSLDYRFVDVSSAVTSFRQAGPVTFVVLDNVLDWTGPIDGVAQETLHVTFLPSGAAVFHGVDVVAESGGGKLTVAVEGKDNGGAFHGTFAITGGSSSLRGHGTFAGFDSCGGGGACGTYSGAFG